MINKLFEFINKSKTEYQAVKNAADILSLAGYKRIYEYDDYNLAPGKYYIIRNMTSIIAFNIPKDIKGLPLNIISTHTDSPSFKIEPNSTIITDSYVSVQSEVYGGAIYSSWFDRPLSIAGRIMVNNKDGIKEVLVDSDKNLLVIPNLCIHFNREINNGYKYNPAIDLRPLLSNNKDIYDVIKDEFNINIEDILSFDLKIYNNDKAQFVGADSEFFMAPRIDNLASLYTALEAFISSSDDTFKFMVSFDNEEVGSRTMNSAGSRFLLETIERIYSSLGYSKDDMYKALSHSMMISADNAHALHPNYTNMYNGLNAPVMNNGFVIKYNASGTYTTEAFSASILKKIAIDNNIAYQEFVNKENIRGGSTLGNILQSSVSIHMIDIGLPQLAMHSANETAGVYDIDSYFKIMKEFYNSKITIDENNIYIK